MEILERFAYPNIFDGDFLVFVCEELRRGVQDLFMLKDSPMVMKRHQS